LIVDSYNIFGDGETMIKCGVTSVVQLTEAYLACAWFATEQFNF